MLLILFGFSLLASAITANKMILKTLPLFYFTGLRMLIAGLILLTLYSLRNHIDLKKIKTDFPALLLIALFTTFIQTLLKNYALKYLFSSKAALIGSIDPFVTALLAYFLLGERLSFKKSMGIMLGIAGSVYLCTTTSSLEETFFSISIFSAPELAAFAAIFVGRIGWLKAQALLKLNRYTPIELNSIMMILSGISSLVFSFVIQEAYPSLDARITIETLLLLAYTIIVGNVIAYSLYATFLKTHSANFVSLVGFSVPLFVSLYGWMLLEEPLSEKLLIAALITFCGVLLFYQDEFKKKTEQ